MTGASCVLCVLIRSNYRRSIMLLYTLTPPVTGIVYLVVSYDIDRIYGRMYHHIVLMKHIFIHHG
jgi:hypothetical protein